MVKSQLSQLDRIEVLSELEVLYLSSGLILEWIRFAVLTLIGVLSSLFFGLIGFLFGLIIILIGYHKIKKCETRLNKEVNKLEDDFFKVEIRRKK